MARIVVASGRPIELSALADVVRAAGHDVVGEAATGRKALLLVREVKPELVVMSTDLPMFNPPEFLSRIRAFDLKTRTLLYGDEDAHLVVQGCFDAGIDGFVGRHENVEELRRALAAVLGGHRYFPRREQPMTSAGKRGDASNPLSLLTARELTIMAYLARGMTNSEIASELALSHKTVSAHRSKLCSKLEVRSVIELARLAQRYGLVGKGVEVEVGRSETFKLSEHDAAVLRSMLDGTPIPLHLRDLEGRLVACNQEFLALHHTTFESVAGTQYRDLASFDPATARELDERYRSHLAAGRPVSADRRFVRNGKETTIYTWMAPYRNEQGELLGMVCGSIDLTGREEVKSLLAMERDSAAAVAKSMSRVLGALCDELQTVGTLLRTLGTRLSFTTGETDDGALEQQAADTAARLERVGTAIHDLLALEDGNRKLVFNKVAPEAVVGSVVDALKDGARARNCTVRLSQSVPDDSSVLLDGERFFKAVYLLLGRQIVLGEDATIDICVEVRDWSAGMRQVTLEISHSSVLANALSLQPVREAASELIWLLCRRFVEFMHGSLTTSDSADRIPRVTMRFLVPAA